MSDDALELPIHIGGCQKWVTGLGRRTTCDDIIYALLRHETNPNEYVKVTNFAIFERWRGVERPLKGRTKILKVWKAWGEERHHVQFYVRKYSSPLDVSIDLPVRSKRSRKQHLHCSKHKDRVSSSQNHQSQPQSKSNPTSKEVSRVRGRRETRSEKPTSQNLAPEQGQTDNDKLKAKEFQDLVQLIIHQEKRIQEQLTRVHEMDVQIENYETKIHFMRVAENGQNYVQEAYLRDKSEESSSSTDDLFPTVKKKDMEAYMHICDNILEMEDKISKEQSKIADLSIKIQEESFLEPPLELTSGQDDSTDSGNSSNPEERLIVEVERMRIELERCMSLGEAQQHQLTLVNETLSECEGELQKKRDFMEKLCLEMGAFEQGGADYTKELPKQADKARVQKGGSNTEITVVEPSHNRRQQGPVKSTERESGPHIVKEHQGSPNLPPPTVTRTGDEAVDKVLMDYYVTKPSYPSSSCTSQYIQQNKHQNFDNDSNSDTGLSSLHSDEAPPILETLV